MPEAKGIADDAVHVALAVYDPKGTYARHAGVVMASLFENTKSPVCVHILHDGTLTERNRSLLNETAEMYAQRAAFHDVSGYRELMREKQVQKALGAWSVGILFRLLIPRCLSVDKAIYLDCDVVVHMDIRELWDIPLEGRSLAGVLERPRPYGALSHKSLMLKLMGGDRRTYINSGVLLMNLSKIRRECDLFRRGILWLARYGHCAGAPDQDFFNCVFRGDIEIIEKRFNNRDLRPGEDDIAASVLHMALLKPWEVVGISAVDRLYWKFFFKTPFGRRMSREDVVEMMVEWWSGSPFMHRHTSQCYKKIWRRFRENALWNDLTIPVWFCLKEAFSKAKRLFSGKRIKY
jgi:lipopolysaccharide biosynthesis glycosyltransferase